MIKLLNRVRKILNIDLDSRSRILLLMAFIVMAPTLIFPLWNMTFWSYQYPEGLNLYIYAHKLDSGNDGNDITEINILNHYIGMAPIEEEDFNELKWIPLALGAFAALTMRAFIFGTIGKVVDVLILYIYFGMFSTWSFWYKLYYYGHNLDPRASITIEPFTPPVFGYEKVGQFKVWSYPDVSTYLILLFGILLVASILLSIRTNMKSHKWTLKGES